MNNLGYAIIDSYDTWVRGFSKYINIITSLQSKLRTLKDGLIIGLEFVTLNLQNEMDSLVVVELISSNKIANAFLSALVDDYKCLMRRLNKFSSPHIYWEALWKYKLNLVATSK